MNKRPQTSADDVLYMALCCRQQQDAEHAHWRTHQHQCEQLTQLENLQQHEQQMKKRCEEQVSLAQQHAAKIESQHQQQQQRRKDSGQCQQQQQGHSFEQLDQHQQHHNLEDQHDGLEQEQRPDQQQRLEHQQQQQPALEQPRPQKGSTASRQQQNTAGSVVAPDSGAEMKPLGISPAATHSGDLEAVLGDRPSMQQHCAVEAAQSDLSSLHSAMAAAQVSAQAATAAAAAAAVLIPPPTSRALQLPSFDLSSSSHENQVRPRHQWQHAWRSCKHSRESAVCWP